jgi:hypothetical protein
MTDIDIARLEDERYAAMLGKDIATLERLLHPDLVYMHSSGVADDKASYIAGVRERAWDYHAIARSDQTVRRHGALALVFNRLKIDLSVRGVAKSLDNRALAVWVADEGTDNNSWRLIALQSGMVPPGV